LETSPLIIPNTAKMGFESSAELEPVMANTTSITTICVFDVMFQRSLKEAILFLLQIYFFMVLEQSPTNVDCS